MLYAECDKCILYNDGDWFSISDWVKTKWKTED